MEFPKIKKKVNDFLLDEEGKISKKNMVVGGLILGSAALNLIQSSQLVSAGEKTYQHDAIHTNGLQMGESGASPHPEAVIQGQHQHHLSHASHSVYSDSPPGGGDDGYY